MSETTPSDAQPVAWLGPYKSAAEALDGLRRAVAEEIGADPETWPDHGNAPLAIAATVALERARHDAERQKREAAAERARILGDKYNQWFERAEAAEASLAAIPSPLSGEVERVVEGWQPIETAPKDGSQFLAFWPGGGEFVVDAPGVRLTNWFRLGEGGQFILHAYEYGAGSPPTHWMPLPAPPALAKVKP